MDKLIEKFNGNNNLKTNQMYETAVKHANITKEIACDFAEWIAKTDSIRIIQGDYSYMDNYYTPSELFDIYLESIK